MTQGPPKLALAGCFMMLTDLLQGTGIVRQNHAMESRRAIGRFARDESMTGEPRTLQRRRESLQIAMAGSGIKKARRLSQAFRKGSERAGCAPVSVCDEPQASPRAFTRCDRREIFRDAVFLWKIPFEVALIITGSAARKAVIAAVLSPDAMASSTRRR
ncbi:hypothetical protein SI859A1_03188 [Aurantimonas manganoxydans SI85-9A1]|uniref:Uncharacterized protein n=1 Tax=Aurantimonas manganoxydans (strain ATCC BAA-1229 / DSM 21871 / SI85-9A1) TaxID=287752 RepID=Q1YFJ2_AURMS|nr:hypothetical protein SI859A1_03188 [Aurantimonas manganoxydans SI85-9A1]